MTTCRLRTSFQKLFLQMGIFYKCLKNFCINWWDIIALLYILMCLLEYVFYHEEYLKAKWAFRPWSWPSRDNWSPLERAFNYKDPEGAVFGKNLKLSGADVANLKLIVFNLPAFGKKFLYNIDPSCGACEVTYNQHFHNKADAVVFHFAEKTTIPTRRYLIKNYSQFNSIDK